MAGLKISSTARDTHHHLHFRGLSSAAAVVADGARTSSTTGSSSRRAAATASATLFSAEEEAVLEEKGAGHLPPWELMPFRETFDQLQRELVR